MTLNNDIRALTGIRGFAALWVVAFHLTGLSTFLSQGVFGPLLLHGYWGVDIFFVLSGFVLSHAYEQKFIKGFCVREYLRFLGLRFARIYPLHVVTFLSACLLIALGILPGQLVAYEAFMHLVLLHAWGTVDQLNFNYVSWSISAEWFAYLFLSIPCVRWLAKVRLSTLYAVLAAVWCAFVFLYLPSTEAKNLNITYDLAILRIIPEFLAGYIAYRTVKVLQLKDHAFDLSISVGCVGMVLLSYWDSLRVLLLPLTMLLMMGLSVETKTASRIFGNRVSVFMGEISYSIYMSHAILLCNLDYMRALLKYVGIPSFAWEGIAIAPFYVGVVILVSYALYSLVERPCRKWLRNWLNGLLAYQARDNGVSAVASFELGGAASESENT